jgi:hypothetical protein
LRAGTRNISGVFIPEVLSQTYHEARTNSGIGGMKAEVRGWAEVWSSAMSGRHLLAATLAKRSSGNSGDSMMNKKCRIEFI